MKAHQLQDTALRYFLEVVRSGSLSEASRRLHVAASAIGRQIAALEDTLGTPLFERRPHGMVPSDAGELLAAHARRAHLDAERTLEEIQALLGLRSGRVRIATSEGFAGQFLPALVIEFRLRFPGIVFELGVVAPESVSERVRAGEADVGLTFSRAPHRDISVVHHQPAPVLALLRADHPLANSGAVTLRQLAEHPLALPGPDTTLRQLIDVACSHQQLRLEPVLTTNHMPALHHFVLSGGGVTLSGEVSARQLLASGAVVAPPIADAGMDQRDIELQTLAGRVLPAAAQQFLDFLKQRLPEQL